MKNRFANLKSKAVVSGKKTIGGSQASIVVTSPKDKFTINGAALALLGIKAGDDNARVVLYDFLGEDGVETVNERFAISVGYMEGKELTGAKVSKQGNFSFSSIWSAMLKGDTTTPFLNADELVKEGLCNTHETESGKVSLTPTKKVTFFLKPALDEDGEPIVVMGDDTKEVPLFELVDRIEKDYTSGALTEEDLEDQD